MLDRYLADLRSSARIFRRSPGLALTAVLALALGVGLTTTMFSIVRGGTRALPFTQPEELVALTRTVPATGQDLAPGAFDFHAWARGQRSFEGLAAIQEQSVNLGGDARRPERRTAGIVSPATFALVGASPTLGRVLQEDDARPGAPAVVLLGHGLWRERFDADPGIIGREIRVEGAPRTVVGVMPPRFGFPVRSALWLPLEIEPNAAPSRQASGLVVFGRLRDGVPLDQARVELATIAAGIARDHPTTHADLSARVMPFVEVELAPNTAAVLTLMLACVSLVLLIACANVANLLLARAAMRSRELAVRAALGATRGQLVALHVTEAMALAAVGGVLGFLLARLAVPAFAGATGDILDAFWIDFRVDGTVALFATVAVGAAGLMSGLLPGLRASRANVADMLRDAAATATGIRIGRLARSLVLAEVALATGLMIMTMTLTRTAVALRATDFPFDAGTIHTAQLALTEQVLGDPAARAAFARDLGARVAGIPGVEAHGLASVLPGRGAGNWSFSLDAPRAEGDRSPMPLAGLVIVTPGFFDALGATPRAGRLLVEGDRAGAPEVAVVNETWVRRYSADRDPLGRRLFIGGRTLEVVGVVSDLHLQDPGEPEAAGIFASMSQLRPFAVRLLARTSGDPMAITESVRDAVEAVDPDLPVFESATLQDAIFADKRVLDAFATIFFVAGLGALFLTMLGVYGIVAFAVASRTREIGVRVALGATRGAVVRLVARQAGRVIAIGIAIGLLLAFGISQALSAATDFIQPAAPGTYALIAAALLATAAVALVRPVWRALSLDPVTALREW